MKRRSVERDQSRSEHGGDLDLARRLFPDAVQPWIDLSTGINPHSYPLSQLPSTVLRRLPDGARLVELEKTAARAYGAADPVRVVAAPGTQILLPMVLSLVPHGNVRILGPTYSEYLRTARHVGHAAEIVTNPGDLAGADLAVVVNPNNPDGRLIDRAVLLDLARAMSPRGGMLVVDEAFMDVAPEGYSLAGRADAGNIVVLRSFGKFYGLAGIRLGFAIAEKNTAMRLSQSLGPWAVSGPALELGLQALSDRNWRRAMRHRLSQESAMLDGVLADAGLKVEGGTSLFRFVSVPDAHALFTRLGRDGVLVRRFADFPGHLRIGILPDGNAFTRLRIALSGNRQ